MKENKQITISLSALIVIVVLLIVLIGIGIYIIKLKPQSEENKVTIDESKITVNTNEEEQKTNEKFTELSIESNIVKASLQKLNFQSYVFAEMLQNGNFNRKTIPNELVLRMGWSSTDDEDFNYDNYVNNIVTFSRSNMEKSIKNIFGPNITYKDASFAPTQLDDFAGGYREHGPYEYDSKTETYSAHIFGSDEQEKFSVWQEVYKAEKSENKLRIYVRVIYYNGLNYLEPEVIGLSEEEILKQNIEVTSEIYKNIAGNTAVDKLGEVSNIYEKYNGNYIESSKGAEIALGENPAFDSIRNKLNKYVYTFEIKDGNYYLSEFEQVK